MHPESALAELGRYLLGSGYRFVTPTPATHQRVLARRALKSCPKAEADFASRVCAFRLAPLRLGRRSVRSLGVSYRFDRRSVLRFYRDLYAELSKGMPIILREMNDEERNGIHFGASDIAPTPGRDSFQTMRRGCSSGAGSKLSPSVSTTTFRFFLRRARDCRVGSSGRR
jgi:hypothetical protein